MKQDTKRTLADFTNRAMQRLQDKQVQKKQQLHIPSLDANITSRSLTRDEIVECQTMEEEPGSNRADKYCIYLAVVDPDLHAVAKEIMDKEADLPADQRQLKEALDVVDILEPYEITEVAMAIMRLSGVIGDKKDGEAYLLHYYIQKGWKIEEFLGLDQLQRLWYHASMVVAMEERAKMFDFGGG